MSKTTNHLIKYLAVRKCEQSFESTSANASRLLERSILTQLDLNALAQGIETARQAKQAKDTVEKQWKNLSGADREAARKLHFEATEIGYQGANLGGYYSGKTSKDVLWGESASARTSTEYGERYSSSCKYSKTDATHTVTLDPKRVEHLVNSPRLRTLSSQDGLHLIALDPDGAAVWVKTHRGKGIESESGWIIGCDLCCYHSTVSREDAVKGHAKKRNILVREHRADRRSRLIARLCCNVRATIADAKSLGYCDPGIAAFRAKHSLGESASLPDLCRTKDPLAIRLALHLARKIKTATTTA